MNKFLPLIIFLLLPGCWWLSSSQKTIKGSGNVIVEHREVEAASELEIRGPGKLLFTQGKPAFLSIECDENFLSYIKINSDDDELSIKVDKGVDLQATTPIVYNVTLPELEEVELEGAISFRANMIKGEKLSIELEGATRIDATLDIQELKVESRGATKINLEGAVHQQKIDLMGASHYNAGQLKSKECKIELSGATRATINASNTLDVVGDGAAIVAYTGEPKVSEKLSGSASVAKVG